MQGVDYYGGRRSFIATFQYLPASRLNTSLLFLIPQGAGGSGGTASAAGGPTDTGAPACCRRRPSSIRRRSCCRMYQIQTFQDMNTTRGMTNRIHRKRLTLYLAMTLVGSGIEFELARLDKGFWEVSVDWLQGKLYILTEFQNSEALICEGGGQWPVVRQLKRSCFETMECGRSDCGFISLWYFCAINPTTK